MTHTPRMFFMLAALAGGVLAASARADDTRLDAVVTGRHYEVPPPRSDYLRLNTPHQLAPEPIVVRPVAGNAQVSPVVPVTPRTGGTIQVAAGPNLTLDQPGLPAGAREEALRTGAMPMPPAGNGASQPVVPLQSTASAGQASASVADATSAGVPPPRVFQTMKQAASAAPVAPVATAIAPVRPVIAVQSWQGRAMSLITAYPMALPGCALFLVLLAFLFKRSRTPRGGHDSDE